METTQIVNIIFYVLLIIGFLSYQIWLGSELVKAKKNRVSHEVETEWKIDEIYRSFNVKVKDLHKDTDRLDSRLDTRVNEVERNFVQDLLSTERNLQDAINALVEDVDELNNAK